VQPEAKTPVLDELADTPAIKGPRNDPRQM